MTNKEAWQYIKERREMTCQDCYSETCNPCPDRDYFNMAMEALEKQIPKKPEIMERKYKNREEPWYHTFCPVCFKKLSLWDALIDKGTPYCRRCGQAMDWSEVEG